MASGGHLQPTGIASDTLQLQSAHAHHMAAAAAGHHQHGMIGGQQGGATTALIPAMHAATPGGGGAHHMHHHHLMHAQGAGQMQPSATAALFVAATNIATECDLKDLFTRYDRSSMCLPLSVAVQSSNRFSYGVLHSRPVGR